MPYSPKKYSILHHTVPSVRWFVTWCATSGSHPETSSRMDQLVLPGPVTLFRSRLFAIISHSEINKDGFQLSSYTEAICCFIYSLVVFKGAQNLGSASVTNDSVWSVRTDGSVSSDLSLRQAYEWIWTEEIACALNWTWLMDWLVIHCEAGRYLALE